MMIPSILLVSVLLGAAFAAPIIPALEERQDSSCARIHIIAARGSNEAPGPGSLRTLVAMIQARNPGADLESINYPALLAPYDASSSAGTAAVTSQLTSYVNRCPNSKVVLVGYSQGAHILLDSLCGGGGYPGLGPSTAPISRAIGDHVTAVVQYGDPRHIMNVPYNAGTADHAGKFPRQLPAQSCAYYASKIKAWCDNGDPFCDKGFDLNAHLNYDTDYDRVAADFVTQKLA